VLLIKDDVELAKAYSENWKRRGQQFPERITIFEKGIGNETQSLSKLLGT